MLRKVLVVPILTWTTLVMLVDHSRVHQKKKNFFRLERTDLLHGTSSIDNSIRLDPAFSW